MSTFEVGDCCKVVNPNRLFFGKCGEVVEARKESWLLHIDGYPPPQDFVNKTSFLYGEGELELKLTK